MSRHACGRHGNACRPAGPGRGAYVGLNKTRSPPCMRCRGPCLASPHRPASCLAYPYRAPPARVRNPREAQVSLLLPRPGVASGQCPFLTVKAFLLPRRGTAQALRRIIFWFFHCPHICPQAVTGYPHSTSVFHRLMHSLVNRLPGVTRRTLRLPCWPPKPPLEKFRRPSSPNCLNSSSPARYLKRNRPAAPALVRLACSFRANFRCRPDF
jgi:hypothetical protein